MQVDYLIIGQGICGTMLSWRLHREGKTFLVMDDHYNHSATQVAAGIINPVTGRRYVYSWMIEEVMAFAWQAYKEIGEDLASSFIFEKSIIDFFPSPQMRDAFINRLASDDTYLHTYPDQNFFNHSFQQDFGCGEIRPAYLANLQLLLASWRKKLFELDSIREEKFDAAQLTLEKDSVRYQDIQAEKIIFCDGISAMQNPWFQLLPFSAVKGEALIIEAKDIPPQHIYKKGIMLVPMPVENTFWVGSNYIWEFDDAEPTPAFYAQTTAQLKHWLKTPFDVLFHKAAVRPATIERRPFVGLHPLYPQIGILNGMGTKGTSLAPFFAHQLTQHLVHGLPLMDEANVHRFSRVLSK